MSDITGDRPEDQTTEPTTSPDAPSTQAAAADDS